MRQWFGTGRGRLGLALGVVALLAVGVFLAAVGTGKLPGADADPSERAIKPAGAEKSAPEPVAEETVETADKEVEAKPEGETQKEEQAEKEPEKKAEEPNRASASASASAPAAVPADPTMSLTVPAMGISDIPVVEGTTEASLSVGAGHYTGSGYPWEPGSNTYIAGHRIGYPGTASDRVFWDLPNLGMGDKIFLTDSNGHTYTYAVSDILEVPVNDLSVTAPTGESIVSLQTCIEDYGDYWTPGPNWNVRYVVRGTIV